MISLNNLANNPNMTAIANKGVFTVFEHQKDMSVSPAYASVAYFMHEMNVRKRQVLCNLNNSAVRIQAGAMQWAAGQVESETGVKGVGDFIGKAFKGAVTNESAVKPIYRGSGFLMLEPTYRYIILEDIGAWEGGIVLDDGLFLACDASLDEKIVSRTNALPFAIEPTYWIQMPLLRFLRTGLLNGPSSVITISVAGAEPAFMYVQTRGEEETVLTSAVFSVP